MKTWTLALALVAIGCQPMDDDKPSQDTEPTTGDTDTGVDDTDTGPDDTDTAEDTDTATDTDTAEETVESPTCVADDLEFVAEVRDANGNLAETFLPTDMPMLAGVVQNPCDDGHVTLNTTSTCLVELWTITPPEGEVIEVRPVCDPTATEWKVRPAGKEEATYKMETVIPGDYEVQVRFTYGGQTAETSFTVEEAETPEEPEEEEPEMP